jgi:hypothetical protein
MKEGRIHWQNKYRLLVDIVVQHDNFICQHNAHFQLNSNLADACSVKL